MGSFFNSSYQGRRDDSEFLIKGVEMVNAAFGIVGASVIGGTLIAWASDTFKLAKNALG